MKEDAELKQFRELMPPPDHWEDGFGLKAMIGGLFVGIVMTPASIYMQLVVGADIGPAAQWVTIILFIEVARRSFTILKRPEIFILYYMAGATLLSTNPDRSLPWNQFLAHSESFRQFGLADKLPTWVTPSSPDVLGLRSFFHPAWYAPIGLLILGQFLTRVESFGLGYLLFRLTSDVEKLPFPMAPVGAEGVTALADASGGKETWRWRVFSFGAMLGIAFGAVYLALPAITGAFLPEPISFFALPFKDFTSNIENILPAVPLVIAFDLGMLLIGMVLPFWAMVGSFIGMIIFMAMNPVLYHAGILKSWSPGLGAMRTIQSNTLDFYFSFGLGLSASIAAIGIYHIVSRLFIRRGGTGGFDWSALLRPPKGRGDFPLWVAAAVYFLVTAGTIWLACALVQNAHTAGVGGPVNTRLIAVLVFYGFIYTPIIGYVSARMEGIVGMHILFPFVREA